MFYPKTIKGCEEYIMEQVNAANGEAVSVNVAPKFMSRAKNNLIERGEIVQTKMYAGIKTAYVKKA